jgi:hypothetical protein
MASAWREVVFLKFFFFGGGNFPPEVPRINTGCSSVIDKLACLLLVSFLVDDASER